MITNSSKIAFRTLHKKTAYIFYAYTTGSFLMDTSILHTHTSSVHRIRQIKAKISPNLGRRMKTWSAMNTLSSFLHYIIRTATTTSRVHSHIRGVLTSRALLMSVANSRCVFCKEWKVRIKWDRWGRWGRRETGGVGCAKNANEIWCLVECPHLNVYITCLIFLLMMTNTLL